MTDIRHIFSIRSISKEFMESVFDLAASIGKNPQAYAEHCKGKILATLFFEPSTRTMLSFESAMLRLGGQIMGFASGKTSSSAKGETIADTIRMINGYSDIAVIRHYMEGVGEIAKTFATIPLISGGTGTQEHPTQALLDLYTLRSELGKLDGISIGLMGDLKYGRTIPSLLYGLAKYTDVNVTLIAPKELQVRENVNHRLKDFGISFSQTENYSDVLSDLDALYVTRIQKERFPDQLEYERLKGSYKLSFANLENVKDNFILLHPLPRVDEIHPDVDSSKYAKYFVQAQNGVWTRMALILKLLGIE